MQATWDKIGTELPLAGRDVRASFEMAGLLWSVGEQKLERVKCFNQYGNKMTAPVDTHKAIVRSDTGELFNVVSDKFRTLQNEDVAEILQSFVDDGTLPPPEAFGVLRGGRRVWARVHAGSFLAGARDRLSEFLYFVNSHDGSGAFRVFPSTTRHACQNVLDRASYARDVVSIAHKSGMRVRIEQARPAIMAALEGGKKFRQEIVALAERRMNPDEIRDYFRAVYSALWPEKVLRASQGEQAAEREVSATLRGWIDNLRSPRNIDTGTEGSAWAALNAVTEWAEHGRTVRATTGEAAEETRQWARLFGAGAEIKATALGKALAVLA